MSSSSREGEPDAAALLTRYLRSRVRSTHEAVNYLSRRGIAQAQAEQAVSGCRRQGLLDDRACARLWAEQWARRGYAWSAIHAKLSAKGLGRPAVAAAAADVGAEAGDPRRARRFIAGSLARRAAPLGRARLARTLAARGFDADLIEQVLDESFGPLVHA